MIAEQRVRRSEVTGFLAAVWGDGFHSLCAQTPGRTFRSVGTYDTPNELIRRAEIEARRGPTNLWFGRNAMAERPLRRGGDEDVTAVASLSADLDWADPAHKSTDLPSEKELRLRLNGLGPELRPSVIVRTGHGLQPWWILDGALDAEAGGELQASLDERLIQIGLRNERADLASVMRLPGSLNVRAEPHHLVHFETLNLQRRFLPEYLRKRLPGARPRSSGSTRHTGGSQTTPGQRDLLGELVANHGAHSPLTVNGTILVTRPGKEASDGSSASIIIGREGDALLTVFSHNWDKIGPVAGEASTSWVLRDGELKPSYEEDFVLTDDDFADEKSVGLLWTRSRHAAVAAAAERMRLTPEALLVAVLGAVALHIPPAVKLRGPRFGTPNMLICIVAHPGVGKGTTIDRALQLVPPPDGYRRHPLGTAQGLVKEFHHKNPSMDKEEVKRYPLVRHTHPVLITCDEISSFAAKATAASGRGGELLAELKRMVSGEQLGAGYASDDKNLRCAPLTYRGVAIMCVAPLKAAPLMDDLGGGLPERLLFVEAVPPSAAQAGERPSYDPEDIDGRELVVDEHSVLAPIDWSPPTPDGNKQEFGVDPSITRYLSRLRAYNRAQPSKEFEAHIGLLMHQLAAAIAFFDGRQDIGRDDFAMAQELIEYHTGCRERLIAAIASVEARKSRLRVKAAVAQSAAVSSAERERARQHWIADQGAAIVQDVTDSPGVTVKELRDRIRSDKRAWWAEALALVLTAEQVVERIEETTPGGSLKRSLWLP